MTATESSGTAEIALFLDKTIEDATGFTIGKHCNSIVIGSIDAISFRTRSFYLLHRFFYSKGENVAGISEVRKYACTRVTNPSKSKSVPTKKKYSACILQ